jgi:hypothetical protein
MEDWNQNDRWKDDVNLMYETDPQWKAAIDRWAEQIREDIDKDILEELFKKYGKRKETDENLTE